MTLVSEQRWQLLTMLPVIVSLPENRTVRLSCRTDSGSGQGVTFEITEPDSGLTLWSFSCGSKEDALAAWGAGLAVPVGTLASEVFRALSAKQLARQA